MPHSPNAPLLERTLQISASVVLLSDDLAKDRESLAALGKMLESEKAAVVAIVPGHTGIGKLEELMGFTSPKVPK